MKIRHRISLAFATSFLLMILLCLSIYQYVLCQTNIDGFISRLNIETVLRFIGGVAFAGLGVVFVLWMYTDRILFSRFEKLVSEVKSIQKSADRKQRFSAPGDDELSRLCSELNSMLDVLESSQNKLLKTRRRLSNVVSNVPGVVFEVALDENDELAFHFLSEEAQEFLGYDWEGVERKNSIICQSIEKERREELRKSFIRSLKEQDPWTQTIKIFTKDNEEKWLRVQCRPRIGCSSRFLSDGVALDVTENHRAELEIEETAHEWQAAFDALSDCILVLDTDRRVKRCNKAFTEFAGLPFEDALGKPCNEIVQTDGDSLLKVCEEACKSRWRVNDNFKLDGRVYELAADPIINDCGLCGVVLVISDITEKRSLEKELLRVSEKEKCQIGRDIHDSLGQKLTGIALQSKILSQKLKIKGLPETEKINELTCQINNANEEIRALAQGLYPDGCDSEGLIAGLKELSEYTERVLGTRCEFAGTDAVDVKDEDLAIQLYRIAQEAINNAVKHGNARQVKISLSGNDAQSELKIEDDGDGLPEKESRQKGMGLRIMKYRANTIGGELCLGKNEHGGAVVVCRFCR